MTDDENKIDAGMKKLLKGTQEGEQSLIEGKSSHPNDENKLSEGDKSNKQKNDEAKRDLRRLTGWDDDESVNISLRTIIGGDVLAGRWFRRHFAYLFFLVFLAILYVTNRYAYQKEMIDNRKLTLKLEDRRLRAVVSTSNLTEYTRRSNISTQLPDTTLKSSPEPFYYLQTEK